MSEKIEDFESVVDYNTTLENFNGPLDLLLSLVKEAKINIREIFVSEVTEQFVAYVKNSNNIEMEKLSEYLGMAVTLLELKSKAILPKVEDDSIFDTIEDNSQEVFFQMVEEYELFKEASMKLKNQETVNRFYKPADEGANDVKVIYKDFNFDNLIKAFVDLMTRTEIDRQIKHDEKEIPKEVYTVKDEMLRIVDKMKEARECDFFELFEDMPSVSHIITSFQAVLEMLKRQVIKVEQSNVYGNITIKLNENGDENIGELGDLSEYN